MSSDALNAPLLPGRDATTRPSACDLHTSCFLNDGIGKNTAGPLESEQKRIQRKLMIACVLATLFLIVEVIGGYLAQSVAIMSDAAHMLSDVAGFAMSLTASYAVTWRSHHSYSFGYHRAEIIGALFSTLIIWAVTGALLWEAIERVINPQPVDGKIMFIVAVAGVLFNIVLSLVLGEQHSHGLAGKCTGHDHHDEEKGHAKRLPRAPDHGHNNSLTHAHDHNHDHDHAHDHDHDHDHDHAAEGGSHGDHAHDGHDDHDHGHDHDGDHDAPHSEPNKGQLARIQSHHVQDVGSEVHSEAASRNQSMDTSHAVVAAALSRMGRQQPHQHGPGCSHGSESSAAPPPLPISENAHSITEAAAPGAVGGGLTASKPHVHGKEVAKPHAHGKECSDDHDHDNDHDHDHGHGHSHGHSHGNLNMRSAVLHVVGDLLQSIGVAIAGALIWFHQEDPRWVIADPICTFVFAFLVLLTTKNIIQDIIHTLMERTPVQHDIVEMVEAMTQIEGVLDVHDLHVWNLSMGIPIMTAHVHADPEAPTDQVLRRLEAWARSRGILHSTVQICNPQMPLEGAGSQSLPALAPPPVHNH